MASYLVVSNYIIFIVIICRKEVYHNVHEKACIDEILDI